MVNANHLMKSGIIWTAIDKYSNFVVNLVISMVLARLISPGEFGIVATASVLLAFLTLFTNVGISPAIIQEKGLSQKDVDQIFTFTILLGVFISFISFLSSWIIADFYEDKKLVPIIQILSLGLFLSTLNIVPEALMSKNFRFKEKAVRSIIVKILFGIAGVIAAFYGAGVYALVWPQIASFLFTFIFNNYFYPVHVKLELSLAPIKKIFSFSFYVFLTNFANYLGRNLDKLIIGKILSSEALGYYDKSYRLMQLPMTYVSSVIYPVLQPVLSTMQNDFVEMSRKYTKVVSFIAFVSFPIAVMLFFASEDIIIVLFGEVWLPAVPSFRILALSIPLTLICNPNGAVYMACNATKAMFNLTIIGLPVFLLLYLYAGFVGRTMESFAWAWTINEFFGVAISYYVLYVKVMHASIVPVIKALKSPIIGAISLVLIYIFYGLIVPSDLNHIAQLIIKIMIAIIYTLILLKVTDRYDIIEYVKGISSKHK